MFAAFKLNSASSVCSEKLPHNFVRMDVNGYMYFFFMYSRLDIQFSQYKRLAEWLLYCLQIISLMLSVVWVGSRIHYHFSIYCRPTFIIV